MYMESNADKDTCSLDLYIWALASYSGICIWYRIALARTLGIVHNVACMQCNLWKSMKIGFTCILVVYHATVCTGTMYYPCTCTYVYAVVNYGYFTKNFCVTRHITINDLKHSLARIWLFSLSNISTALQRPLSMTGTIESMHDFYIYYHCPTERKRTMKMGKKQGREW